MTHRIVTGVACVILSASTINFIDFLKWETAEPLEEIQVTFKRPVTMVELLISNCKNELGKLQQFLDCREEIVLQYK